MFLNFTFFVQILNFFITYWFCKQFFFTPVLKIILLNRQQKKLILEECSTTKLKLLELEQNKKNILKEFQLRTFEKQKTLPKQTILPIDQIQEEPLTYQKEELISTAKSFIKNKALS